MAKNKYKFWGKKRGDGIDVAALQTQIKQTYINKFYNIWMTKFKWSGLDEDNKEQEENFIMRKFWSEGTLAVRMIPNTDLFAFTSYAASTYNMYDMPETITLVNLRGVSENIIPSTPQIVNKNAVIGWCQPNHKPINVIVNFYVDRITQVDMVINTNLQLQKMPFLIGVDEVDREKMEDIVDKMLNNEVVVFTDLTDLQKVQSIVTQTPYVIDKLTAYKAALENELLTYLGVDNVGGNEKKERMLVDEVNATNDIINDYGHAIEDEINKWLDRINKVFNKSISIETYSQPVDTTQGTMTPKEEDPNARISNDKQSGND